MKAEHSHVAGTHSNYTLIFIISCSIQLNKTAIAINDHRDGHVPAKWNCQPRSRHKEASSLT
jgi:hypothetical protein